jgi:hypothetical protein
VAWTAPVVLTVGASAMAGSPPPCPSQLDCSSIISGTCSCGSTSGLGPYLVTDQSGTKSCRCLTNFAGSLTSDCGICFATGFTYCVQQINGQNGTNCAAPVGCANGC